MGKNLHKLGAKMFSLKWWIVAGWLVIIAVVGVAAFNFMGPTTSTISIPGTEAQKTLDRFKEIFPNTGSSTASVVVAAPAGKTINDYQTQITDLTSRLSETENVTMAVSPFDNPSAQSDDKTIAFITLQLDDEDGKVASSTIEAVNNDMSEARTNGLTVEAGGTLSDSEVGDILGVGEVAGVLIALVVLVITLGSLVAAGLPIITALVTIAVSMAGLFAVSSLVELSSVAPILAVMLGLAVGIDYSLFIINRYRTYVKEGYDLQEAAGKAIGTAGNAVIFAAATVVIALAALSIVQIPFMTVMGVSAAVTVAIAALVAITLMPAIFGIVKLRIFSRKERKEIIALEKSHKIKQHTVSRVSIWYRLGDTILKYRKTFLVAALALIVTIALPVTQLQLGLPSDETAAESTSGRKAYDLLAKGFGAGYNGPLILVTEGLKETTEADKDALRSQLLAQYQSQAGGTTQAASTSPEQQQAAMAELEKQVEQYAPLVQLQQIADRVGEVEGVAKAQAVLTADNGTKGIIQVTPTTGPSDEATTELVHYLRESANQYEILKIDGASFGVTGQTAVQIDINNKLAQALPLYMGVVVGLSLILLLVAFRSIWIPIKATLGFVLSVLAMFGALVAVQQWGWFGITETVGPVVSFIPIIAIGIVFGLAMDYEFFLVSGMQEAYHKNKDARKAILAGFANGSRVVIAAGLIMVAVFAGFITNHNAIIQSIGFALAVGIFIDAFIVRMIIVPVVMSYMGKSAWWIPKWLDKRLPKVSIEGEA